MTEEKKRWKWWQKLAMAMAVILLVLIAGLIALREPWITPLPGVSLELAHPLVPASALGPGSAYRLLLEAVAEPLVPPVAPESGDKGGMFGDEGSMFGDPIDPIWGSTGSAPWWAAETKFECHPWPATPPPPFAPTAESTNNSEEERFMSGMSAPPGLGPEDPWTLEQYQEIPRLMAILAPRVAFLDRALAAADRRMPAPKLFLSSSLGPSQCTRLVGWLAISAQYRAATGDHVGSHQDLTRILGLADLLRHGPACDYWGTDRRCGKMAARAAWRVAMRSDLPEDLLQREAEAFLEHADHATPYAEILRSNARSMSDFVSLYYPLDIDTAYSFHPDRPPTFWEEIRMGIICRLGPILGSTPQMTARNLQTVYQNLIPIAEKPYSAALRAEYDRFENSLLSPRSLPSLVFVTPDPFGYMLASSGMFRHHEFSHARVAAHDARMRGIALFLAIKAYEKERGALPERLDQLVPAYLPRLPKDPFDGKPFRYLLTAVPGLPVGTWAVYSIGEDFIDDGGKAHSPDTSDDDHGLNPDLVWPSHPYPKLPPIP